jgi:NitT/TauT family transport system substrate-binding protein
MKHGPTAALRRFLTWIPAFAGMTVFVVSIFAASAAHAADKVRLIISTQGGFELWGPEEALLRGWFKDENLDVSIIYGDGGANTIQAILTGSADIVTGTGSLGVITAFAKGGAITAISNARFGTGDLLWYVRPESPIKSVNDLNGKSLVYSRPGSTTHLAALYIVKEYGLKDVKLVSVGGAAAARTQVMSGQLDTGWAPAPNMLDAARRGEVRIFMTGDAAKGLGDYSIRFNAANSDWLAKNRDVAVRFQRAHWKGIRAMYDDEEAQKHYAAKWGLDLADVKATPKYSPLNVNVFAPVGNLDGLIKLAIEGDMLKEPLTAEQKKKLVDIVYEGPVK